MKRALLTVGAAFVLLPFIAVDAQASHSPDELTSVAPSVLLRCRKTISTETYLFEGEQFEHRISRRDSTDAQYPSREFHPGRESHISRESPIREILRHRGLYYTEVTPIIIDIQGDCDAIRVEIGTERSPNERFPTPRPWLTRPGSGWDWLFRQQGWQNDGH